MNTKQTQARRAEQFFEVTSTMRDLRASKVFKEIRLTDVIIMRSKFYIYMNLKSELILVKSWDGIEYGKITLSHAKRLINNSINRNN
jgi:hypothetical protein